MYYRGKILINDGPHRDKQTAAPADSVQHVRPQIFESDQAVIELDNIKFSEPSEQPPKLVNA